MNEPPSREVEARVGAQYERYPYPARDPEDERHRIIGTWLDNLAILNHHCFRGEASFGAGFRVLVAGGGTGDGTVYLAEQLRGRGAEVVHLELSVTAIDIARRRAVIRGLGDVRFVQGALLDLLALGLGEFDYISCAGVLHHLADPDAGLRALLEILRPDGALCLLLHGRYGRAGVYQMQSLLRRINRDVTDPAAQVANARAVLASLPATNWFRRGEDLHDDHKEGDAGLYDLFLHSQGRAYTVPELYEWLADRHGLHLTFSDVHRGRLPYTVEPLIEDAPAAFVAAVRALPQREREAIAELWRGDLTRHSFYATRHAATRAPYGDVAYAPHIPWETHPPTGEDFAQMIEQHGDQPFALQHKISGLTVRLDPGRYVKAIFRQLDGQRSFREIFERVRRDPRHAAAPPDDATLFAEFRPWFHALESIERMALVRREAR